MLDAITRGDQKVLQLTVIESIFNEFGFLPLLLKLFNVCVKNKYLLYG